jgi:hydroxyacylglutathione hydrolase
MEGMLLKRFYDEPLAQASYLIGCTATGEALVVDPNRDVEQYLRAADAEGLRVTHVAETHIHADYVSGARELAERAGAALHLSGEGGPDWAYAFAREAGAVVVKDGDSFAVGNVRVDVLHTPGHTPEHVAFLVTDAAGADRPMGILSGDFVFVGDVGRPDLLERAAGWQGTMEAGARTLFHSLQTFKRLPDYLQIWPGHGAGSACGKSLGAVPQSTVGYERLFNWALAIDDEDEFVRAVLAGQPEPPKYFAQMKRINREGARAPGGRARPPRLDAARLRELAGGAAVVVDTRPAAAFAAGHVPGTINIPLAKSFATWAGWLVPYDRDVYLVAGEGGEGEGGGDTGIDEALRELRMIGLDRVAGYFDEGAVQAWAAGGRPLAAVPQTTAAQLAAGLAAGAVTVVDVRGRSEWEAGHLPGVPNVPLGYLTDRLATLARDRPLVVHCQSGTRSAIAASVLRAHGVTNVVNLTGGFAEWQAGGHPVETGPRERELEGAR